MKLVIVIPAYNEEKIIGQVLDSLPQKITRISKIETVVVNDGSEDNTEFEIRKRKTTILSHHLNRGLGGALGTGMEYAKVVNADIVVTLDADGQHDPKDINRVIEPIIKKKADFVIGSRLRGQGMPIDRKIVNWIGNLVTFLLFGVLTSDSQSGFRALSKKALFKIKLQMNKMEVSSEFLREAKRHHLKIVEVPIKVFYTEYSKAKGQKNVNAINIFTKLLLHRLVNLK